ncbi:hypothetical protein CCACVL1_19764 [Corchorus capsularis]|uniref:Uncharacterized protein n=1 Tax=Corchorus capsularis TaxID=210143 RepID=A0A1R3HF42_COCAP|nr:hypothetical protein CCACVL1_19764 [Corchorus capsularis]
MALQEAWKAACEVSGAKLEIPSEFQLLIMPITLEGHPKAGPRPSHSQ